MEYSAFLIALIILIGILVYASNTLVGRGMIKFFKKVYKFIKKQKKRGSKK